MWDMPQNTAGGQCRDKAPLGAKTRRLESGLDRVNAKFPLSFWGNESPHRVIARVRKCVWCTDRKCSMHHQANKKTLHRAAGGGRHRYGVGHVSCCVLHLYEIESTGLLLSHPLPAAKLFLGCITLESHMCPQTRRRLSSPAFTVSPSLPLHLTCQARDGRARPSYSRT
jgi:hypothetical protein